MPQFSSGQIFDRWVIEEFIAAGGNAEVWRARGADEETVALKILKSRNVDSEPYLRFRQEVLALERIGSQPGVLPVIEHDLPQKPSRNHRAWLAMPLATPLAEAIQGQPLRDVVAAVASIADTLARLKREHGIHHRDIKPSNLYMWNGQPALGDFGLVDLPEGSEITPSGQPLGPLHFLPYEMLTGAAVTDSGPADVYSLAKTLWVLCTDQRWPPPGEQSATTTPALSVGEYRLHRLAGDVDRLVERGTKHSPVDRPTMEQFAADLRAWLDMEARTPAETVDTSALWKALREAAAPRLTEAERATAEQQCIRAAARRLQELMEPLNGEIRRNFPAADFNARPRYVETFFKLDTWEHEIVREDIRATVISGPGHNPVRLAIGVAVMVKRDGLLHYRGLYYLGRTETMGGYIGEWKSEQASAPCGSIALENGLAQLAGEVTAAFPNWLGKLNEALSTDE